MRSSFMKLGLLMIIAGIILIILSFISGSVNSEEVSGGFAACVVIFFIPICFGSGNLQPQFLLVLAFLGFSLAILLIIYSMLRTKEKSYEP